MANVLTHAGTSVNAYHTLAGNMVYVQSPLAPKHEVAMPKDGLISTADQWRARPSPCGEPLGENPYTKWKAGVYSLYPLRRAGLASNGEATYAQSTTSILHSLSGWYWLEYVATQLDTFSKVRETVVTLQRDTFHGVVEFLCDYLISTCLGEARHRKASVKCKDCWPLMEENGYNKYSQLARSSAANGMWRAFKDLPRREALDFIAHVFLDHMDWGSSVGGAPWGYIAILTRRLNDAFASGDSMSTLRTMDELIYAHHCTGSILKPRFSWVEDIFSFTPTIENFNHFLGIRQNGKKCCWAKAFALRYIKKPFDLCQYLVDGTNGCGCYAKDTENGPNPQETFANTFISRERCGCGVNLPRSGRCKNYCSGCGTCIKGKHQHACGACGYKFPAPYHIEAKCPKYCALCEACGDYGHNGCHYCNNSKPSGTDHNYCIRCGYVRVCYKFTTDHGVAICTKCNPDANNPDVDVAVLLQAMETKFKVFLATMKQERHYEKWFFGMTCYDCKTKDVTIYKNTDKQWCLPCFRALWDEAMLTAYNYKQVSKIVRRTI